MFFLFIILLSTTTTTHTSYFELLFKYTALHLLTFSSSYTFPFCFTFCLTPPRSPLLQTLNIFLAALPTRDPQPHTRALTANYCRASL